MNEEATPANTKSTCVVNTKTTIIPKSVAYAGMRSELSSQLRLPV